MMHIGAVFPQTEIGNDPVAIRDYAQAVEDLGYHHILVYDHVLGASTVTRPGWTGPYTSETPFHEPFVLFGYLAGLTRQVELVTGVIILPQRQTALVAKQAAEVDVLSNGRLRLGVGIGWNQVEYEALNEDFRTRGARIEEQVEVLRALWTQPVIKLRGRWHQIDEAGINPLPIQRPIPIWFGGHAEPMLKRAARLGDGWFPLGAPNAEATGMVERLRTYTRMAGRTPQDLGIEAFVHVKDGTEDAWVARAEGWSKLGATHLAVNTMGTGFRSPQNHIEALRRAKDVLG
jgi:probable F420-dependent oxidoreductase